MRMTSPHAWFLRSAPALIVAALLTVVLSGVSAAAQSDQPGSEASSGPAVSADTGSDTEGAGGEGEDDWVPEPAHEGDDGTQGSAEGDGLMWLVWPVAFGVLLLPLAALLLISRFSGRAAGVAPGAQEGDWSRSAQERER